MVDKKTVHVELHKGVAARLNQRKQPGHSYSDVIKQLLDEADRRGGTSRARTSKFSGRD